MCSLAAHSRKLFKVIKRSIKWKVWKVIISVFRQPGTVYALALGTILFDSASLDICVLFVCFHRMSKRDCISFSMCAISRSFSLSLCMLVFVAQQLHVLKFQIYFSKSEKNSHSAFDFCMTQKIKIYNQIPSALHFSLCILHSLCIRSFVVDKWWISGIVDARQKSQKFLDFELHFQALQYWIKFQRKSAQEKRKIPGTTKNFQLRMHNIDRIYKCIRYRNPSFVCDSFFSIK